MTSLGYGGRGAQSLGGGAGVWPSAVPAMPPLREPSLRENELKSDLYYL